MTKKQFHKSIYDYFKRHGRVLPWRETTDPYKILVSELMLQQTQVDRVIPKFKAFIEKFPTVYDLAAASVADVLLLWSGLGYNRRALYLKKTAEKVVEEYHGIFPQNVEALMDLPGIGSYTARAICTFAFNMPTVFIETNIRTVFLHFFFKDKINVPDTEVFVYIEKMLDSTNPRMWYSALMDYGTMLKKEHGNANVRSRHYTKQSKFKGSDRQVRGAILKFLVAQKTPISKQILIKNIDLPKEKIVIKIQELLAEGFLIKKGKTFSLRN